MTTDATERKLSWVRAAAGPRFRYLELSMVMFAAVVTEHRNVAAGAVADRFGITPEQALTGPRFLMGSASEIVDEPLRPREQHGISYTVMHEDALTSLGPVVQRLKEHVTRPLSAQAHSWLRSGLRD